MLFGTIQMSNQSSVKKIPGQVECSASANCKSSKFSRGNQIWDKWSCDHKDFSVIWHTGDEWRVSGHDQLCATDDR